MNTNLTSLLKQFTEINGISGNEKAISQLLKTSIEANCDEVIYDNLGSIFGVKKAKNPDAPVVMVSGYIDESGFIIKDILDNGTILCLAIGHHLEKSLLGTKINVTTDNGNIISGIIIPNKSGDLVLSKKDELYIHCGFNSKEAAIEAELDYGQSVTYASESFVSSNDTHLYGKAIGRSYGCLQVVNLFEKIKDIDLPFHLYAGATVLNQVGNRGAQTATNLVKPDLAITFDCLDGEEKVTASEKQGILGNGPLVTYYDRSILPNRKLTTDFVANCEVNNIPTQHYYSLKGSDAGWIHKLRTGSPTLMINVAGQNLAANFSVINLEDIANALEATTHFVLSLSNEQIESFKVENR